MVGNETARINGVACASCARQLFGFSKEHSFVFGATLCKTMAHCEKAGDKCVNGSKWAPAVHDVYMSIAGGGLTMKAEPPKLKVEHGIPIKRQLEMSPVKRQLQINISSPSQVTKLYKGEQVQVKNEPVPWPAQFLYVFLEVAPFLI